MTHTEITDNIKELIDDAETMLSIAVNDMNFEDEAFYRGEIRGLKKALLLIIDDKQ